MISWAQPAPQVNVRRRDLNYAFRIGHGVLPSALPLSAPAMGGRRPRSGVRIRRGAGGVATDASGNGRTGVITGATWATGRYGGALSFNGTNAYVDLGSLGTFYKSAFTLEAWVQKSGSTNDVGMLGTWREPVTAADVVDLPSGRTYTLTLGTGPYLDSGQVPLAGQWQHLAATFNGTTARYYVDGSEGVFDVYRPVGNSNTWRIGAYGDTPGGFFDGLVDDVRIYDRALSTIEVQADMSQPSDHEPRRSHDTRRFRCHRVGQDLAGRSVDPVDGAGGHLAATTCIATARSPGRRPRRRSPSPALRARPAISSKSRLRRGGQRLGPCLGRSVHHALRRRHRSRRGLLVRRGLRILRSNDVSGNKNRADLGCGMGDRPQRRRALVQRQQRLRRSRSARHVLQERLHPRGVGAEDQTANDVGVVGTWTRPVTADRCSGYRTTPLGTHLTLGSSPLSRFGAVPARRASGSILPRPIDGRPPASIIDGVLQASCGVFRRGRAVRTAWRIGAYGSSPGGFFDGLSTTSASTTAR